MIVRGIGKHAPNETALTFMNEFTRELPRSGRFAVDVDNLIASVDDIRDSKEVKPGVKPVTFRPSVVRLKEFADANRCVLQTVYVIGFSEVYWAPITAGYRAKNDGPPIPVVTWARSVGTRVLGPSYYERLSDSASRNNDEGYGIIRSRAFRS